MLFILNEFVTYNCNHGDRGRRRESEGCVAAAQPVRAGLKGVARAPINGARSFSYYFKIIIIILILIKAQVFL